MGISIFLFKLCCLTAMSGFLFGYDTGIASGAMIFIKDEMNLSIFWYELIVSSTIGFACITAWSSSTLTSFMGRKPLIILASFQFTLASIVMGLAPNKYVLLVGRAIAGSAIGLGSMIAPIYIAELSPKENRGSLVTFNTAFVTFGILVSTLIASIFSYLPANIGWRFMLGLAGIPSLLQMIGFLSMPESPRYLCLKGHNNNALNVMTQIYAKDLNRAKEEIKLIKESLIQEGLIAKNHQEKGNLDTNNNEFNISESNKTNQAVNIQNQSDQNYLQKLIKIFKDPSTRRCIIVGICLHIGQQFSGINTIMYYGATVIQMSGILSKRMAIRFTVIVGITNATTSFIALFFYDKVTRRKITLLSMSGIVVCLALMGSMFFLKEHQVLPIHDLNDTYTGLTDENSKLIKYCHSKITCNECVQDSRCGYCFDFDNFVNTGRCLPTDLEFDTLKSIDGTFCANGSNEDTNIYFTNANCPSDYGIYILISLCLFLVWYAFGMGAVPWTINAEMYPMWCRSVAVSFAAGFNWLFNLIISFSFLTIIDYISISGTFFLYMFISIIFTIIYYIWLPETKNKSMEGNTFAFHH